MSKQIYTAQGKPVDPAKLKQVSTGLVTVYDIKTGDKDSCFPIDARERISTGGWSYDPPVMKKKTKALKSGAKKAGK